MSFVQGGSSLTRIPVSSSALVSHLSSALLAVFLQATATVIFGAENRWSSSHFDSGEIEVPHSNGKLLNYMYQLGQSDLVVSPEQRSQQNLGIIVYFLGYPENERKQS
jgi:hypothetical protein